MRIKNKKKIEESWLHNKLIERVLKKQPLFWNNRNGILEKQRT